MSGNMLLRKTRQINMSSILNNGIFAPFTEKNASSDMFASKTSYCSPASVLVFTP
ncbi:hypothetical protein JK636_11555 [Clostridium sp. YIM B02515]|uniref:Uncharacterized protein n=1 Tax=Clostridium rhizosphaerae TaxID=2803861 RepID=A0ABS1TEK2_9CLOT|nr:hypothetical protein [Clostridium rhizosphaerae]MBL4936398.1 hypothetical protein [Clostridium rhizosphaerae]